MPRSPSPCRGFPRSDCTSGARLTQCQYASGPKLSFCRKISKRRAARVSKVLDRSRDRAARKIAKAARRMSERKSKQKKTSEPKSKKASKPKQASEKASASSASQTAPLTPLSKHYKTVSEKQRNQPSIYLFRQRCKLFPHPVEIFSRKGLQVPIYINFAYWMAEDRFWSTVPMDLEKHVPPLLPNQHIYKLDSLSLWDDHDQTFPVEEYSTANNDIIVGVKGVRHKHDHSHFHLVFFEVRMKGRDGSPHAMVLNPNGNDAPEYRPDLTHFFGGIPYEIAGTHWINQDDNDMKEHLRELGFVETFQDMWLDGYCATIACFFLIDYVCTNQWVSRDSDHFVRASQEWLVSPEETKSGFFSFEATGLRVVLFARYLAYRMFAVFHPGTMKSLMTGRANMRRVTFQHEFQDNKFYTNVKVGSKMVHLVDKEPRELKSFQNAFKRIKPKRLF